MIVADIDHHGPAVEPNSRRPVGCVIREGCSRQPAGPRRPTSHLHWRGSWDWLLLRGLAVDCILGHVPDQRCWYSRLHVLHLH
jgi:hypothetical protein